MSITDELREWAKMLTHWWYDPVKDEYTYTTGTMPPSIDAVRLDSNIIAIADRIDAEHKDGSFSKLTAYHLTPEQAIAATLGSCNCSSNCTNSERTETCRIDLVGYNQREDRFQCRSCDWSMWFKRGTWPQFNYCPNCGRRIVQ